MIKNVRSAQNILSLLATRHSKDVFVPECKDGPTHYTSHMRLDAWTMNKSWAHPCATGYEIKISRSDFLNDNKWHGYLPLCNQFYFVAPKGLIDVSELAPEVGLLVVIGKGDGTRLLTQKKAPYRNTAIPEEIYRYILMCRVSIAPEINSNGEADFWREWLKRKSENQSLGWKVSKRIHQRAVELETENQRLQARMQAYDRLKEVLNDLGVNPENWEAERILTKRVEAQSKVFDPDFIETIQKAFWALDTALKAAKAMEAVSKSATSASNALSLETTA